MQPDEQPKRRGRPRSPKGEPGEGKREGKRGGSKMAPKSAVVPLPEKPASPLSQVDRDRTDAVMMAIKRELFLSQIREGWSIKQGCRFAGISRSTHYEWMKDADYKKAFESAFDDGTDELEDTMTAMGVNKVMPNFLALMAQLKARAPNKYRENIKVDGEVTHKPEPQFHAKFDAFTKQLREIATKMNEQRRQALIEAGHIIEGEALPDQASA